MCGRFASITPPQMLRTLFFTTNGLVDFAPCYNLAPSQMAPVIRFNPKTCERAQDLLRWGLVPHWAKDAGNGLINARADSLSVKPAFAAAFRQRRCLIPANAFYEWARTGGAKRPYAIRMRDKDMFAFAGLWEGWKTPTGDWLKTFVIITCPANALIGEIHPRMPVILSSADYGLWLGDEPAPPERLQALLHPFSPDRMEVYPVNPAVSSVRNQGPDLLTPDPGE